MIRYLKDKINSLLPGDQNLAELIKGASISFFMKIGGLVCAQLFVLAIARLLGADAFGIFSLSLSLLTIFSIIGAAGLDVGLLRFVAADTARGDKTGIASNYISSLIITVPISLIITFLSFYYSNFIAISIFNKPYLTSHFKIISLGILPFTLIKLNSQGLRGFKEVTKYTFLSFVSRYLVALILLFPLYYLFFKGNIAIVASYVVALWIIAVLSFYWIIRNIHFQEVKINKDRYKKILVISLPLLLASSLMVLKGWIDTLMLGFFLESSDVGVYNVSLKLATMVKLVLTAVNIIAAPKFAELYGEGKTEELNQTIQKSTKLIFCGALPIFLVLFLLPKWILFIFGSEFVNGSISLMILSAGFLVASMSGSVGYVMQMTGKQVAFQNITLMSVIIVIGLNYFLIPVWGINGAAFSTMISLVFSNITSAVYLKLKYNITTYFNPFTIIRKWTKI